MFQDSRALKFTGPLGETGFVVMFDNQHSVMFKQARCEFSESIQHRLMIISVRRVVEDNIPRTIASFYRLAKKLDRVTRHHDRFGIGNSTQREIAFNQGSHLSGVIHEGRMRGAARKGFNPDRTRARAKIEKARLANSGSQNVEERLAQTVRGRTCVERVGTAEPTTSKFAGDYSQNLAG